MSIFPDARAAKVSEADTASWLSLFCWGRELLEGRDEIAAVRARRALADLVALGLPHAVVDGALRYDPVLVHAFIARGVIPEVLAARIATARWACATFLAGGRGRRRFVVDLTRRLGRSTRRVHLPLPFDDAFQTLEEASLLEPAAAKSLRRLGRLEVTSDGMISVSLRMKMTCETQAPAQDPVSIDPCADYLAREEGLVRVTPYVGQMATTWSGAARDAAEIVAALWDGARRSLLLADIHYDALDPADPGRSILTSGVADCLTASALLVACCRARGVPARLVGGYFLHATPGQHFWFEVRVEDGRWMPFDTLGWLLDDPRFPDPAFTASFRGSLEQRLRSESYPRLVTGTTGARLPPRTTRLTRWDAPGTTTAFLDRDTDALVYEEHVRVREIA